MTPHPPTPRQVPPPPPLTGCKPRRYPLALVLVLWLAGPATAVTDLQPGRPAPPFSLRDLAGKTIDNASLSGRPAILLFGELYHRKTLQADRLIAAIVQRPEFRDQPPAVLLVITEKADPADLKRRATQSHFFATVLQDSDRTTYEAYRVAVLPSLVVLDAQGRLVHAMAGLSDRFEDILIDTLALATGRISTEQFKARLLAQAAERPDPATLRANRLTELGRQLVHRGLADLAEEKYRQAMQVRPDHVPARLGLGLLYLRQQRWVQAEQVLSGLLQDHPDLSQAALALAQIYIQRGQSDDLESARTLLAGLLDRHPRQPGAHYLMGLIHEKTGHMEQAAASFRRAAELLLENQPQEIGP